MDFATPQRRQTSREHAAPNQDVLGEMEGVMLRAFSSEKPTLLLAHGGSESMRMRLAEALQGSATAKGALLLASRASADAEDAPYGVLGNALTTVELTFAKEHAAFTAGARNRIARAALSLGKLLATLCPSLASLVETEHEVEPLPPWLARERMEALLLRLLFALSHVERPLVLMIENAQWVDRATLSVLQRALCVRAGAPRLSSFIVVLWADSFDDARLGEWTHGVRARAGEVYDFDLGAPQSGEGLVRPTPSKPDAQALLDTAERAIALAAFEVAEAVLDKAERQTDEPSRALLAAYAPRLRALRVACAAGVADRERTMQRLAIQEAHATSESERQEIEVQRIHFLSFLGEHEEALARAAKALDPLGVRVERDPSHTRLEQAFGAVWDGLGDRAIEEIADLGPMSFEPALFAMDLLFAVLPSAEALSRGAGELCACEMARLTMLHGMAEPSAVGLAAFAAALVSRFGDHRSAYRFGKVALDASEQRARALYRGIVGAYFASHISIWTHHLRASIGYSMRAHEAALASGNLREARRSGAMLALSVLLKGDPLDEVAEDAFAFLGSLSREDKPGSAADAIYQGILRFIDRARAMAPADAHGDGSSADPAAVQLLDLVADVVCGSPTRALERDEALHRDLGSFVSQILKPERECYVALALAQSAKARGAEERTSAAQKMDPLVAALERLAERCPENFQHKHALMRAERCRLLGEDLAAMRLYEEAMSAARENGFTLSQALSAELAMDFYESRGLVTNAEGYKQIARDAYARWGSGAKVAELEQRGSNVDRGVKLRQTSIPVSIRRPIDVDVLSAVRPSPSMSEESVLRRLIVTLMRILIEHGGAQRCVVLLKQDDELCPVGRAIVGAQGVEIEVPGPRVPELSAIVPPTVLGYVERTREAILLQDATSDPQFSSDPYLSRTRPRSVFCLPILRQTELLGVFYLENHKTASSFTPGRLALLGFLATQAAISLDYAKLQAEFLRQNAEHRRTEETLRRSEERLGRLVDIAGVVPWEVDGETELFTYVGPQAEPRLGWPTAQWYKPNFLRDQVHPADRAATLQAFSRLCENGARAAGSDFRMVAKDGRVVWLHIVMSVVEREGGQRTISGFFFDITERKEAEAMLREQIEIIAKQKEDIRVLSTPILDVWDGVVAMPVLGTFDEARAEQAMDILLATISKKGIRHAILDLTGVMTVDAPTSAHLSKLIRAVELLGARAVIVGIRPDVARAIVMHGIGLERVETRATLKDALRAVGARGAAKGVGSVVSGRMAG